MTTYTSLQIWVLMVLSGLVTFLIRYSFIAAEGHYQAPEWFRSLMPFVPIAMLTALTVPDVAVASGALAIGLDNAKLWAAIVAAIVAARWQNILLTIASGFVVLFGTRLFF